ncbi:MAG: cyclopropane fatty acyl phospholipid synthase [Chromatiaceae bacterium]|nr:cyclopropane fatty acyl phospholipid synthase [Chromatiaceae bacterium]
MPSNHTTQTLGSEAPRSMIVDLLAEAGIRVDGNAAWDIRVHDPAFYRHVLLRGSLGLGETFMDGLWDVPQLDAFFHRVLDADLGARLRGLHKTIIFLSTLRNTLFNRQSSRRAYQVGECHYDIGNDVFEAMLDSRMNYSCAYWAAADDLETAQLHKLELICRKLQLKPGERLLDIGCGWGGLAQHAASRYGVQVTGATVSREQVALARERCAGLPVVIELADYRDIRGRFDKVVSVGMFEHVGHKNYREYFDVVRNLLSDEGLFLLHSIGSSLTSGCTDPWIDKYIFPNGQLPSARQLTDALEGRFIIDDWHNFGRDYDHTLMAWKENFDLAWPQLAQRYDQRFYRMWTYYLMSSAGLFRSRQGQLWQLVLSKRRRSEVYRSLR